MNFQVGDALDPSLVKRLGTFDTILSFETIEHVPDDHLFVTRLFDLLKPGGTLVLSTPFGQGRGKPTNQPFHYHQLTEAEFRGLFRTFEKVEYYYQRGVTIEPKREGIYYPLGVVVCKKGC